MEGWKHRESKRGTRALNNSYVNGKKLSWGLKGGKSPELPGDALCNYWFMYGAGPASSLWDLWSRGLGLGYSTPSSYHCASAVPGFVDPEAYIICGGTFKKKNTKGISGKLRKWIFISSEKQIAEFLNIKIQRNHVFLWISYLIYLCNNFLPVFPVFSLWWPLHMTTIFVRSFSFQRTER